MMQKFLGTTVGAFLVHALAVAPVMAQRAYDYTYATADAGAAAGVSILLGCCFLIFGIAIVAGIGYFVYRDAKKNNVDNAILWALLSAFTTWIGLLIYFLAIRPEAIRRNEMTEETPKKTAKKEEEEKA